MYTSEDLEQKRYISAMLRDYGGEVDLTQLHSSAPLVHSLNERANQMCERIVEQDFLEKTPIHFRFILNNEINAFAAGGILPIVGVNIGVPLALLETFARIMCSQQTFLHIGAPSRESRAPSPFLLPSRAVLDLNRWEFANCDVRAAFGNFLARTAFDFLIGHEIGHIARGHHFLLDGSSRNVIKERGTDQATKNITSQVLELDADIHGVLQAAHGTFNMMRALRARHQPPYPNQAEAYTAGAGTPERALETTVFAVWVLFKLFQENLDVPLEQMSHPPLPLRSMALITALVETVSKLPSYEIDFDTAHKTALGAIQQAEMAVQDITCNKQPIYIMQPESPAIKHYGILMQHAEALEPKLSSVQRGSYVRNPS